VWSKVTGETTSTGPTPPAHQLPNVPSTGHKPHSVLPPRAMITRLRKHQWSVQITTRAPKLTRQEAVAQATAALSHIHHSTKTNTWLLSATSHGIPTPHPAVWLVEFPIMFSHPCCAPPWKWVGNRVLVHANTGRILWNEAHP
jgi:hypothetical protein